MEQSYSVDPVQARTYIINNRHNHTTALYYLMEIKLSREGKLIPGSEPIGSSSKPKPVEDNFVIKNEVLSDRKKEIDSPKK